MYPKGANWATGSTEYGGALVFPSVSDDVISRVYPEATIPLYLRDYAVPVRKSKPTEINTISQSINGYEGLYSAQFEGVPEPLTTSFSGWLITKQENGFWEPRGTQGGTMNLTGWSWADVIAGYIEGRIKRDATGRGRRQDPIWFVDPYGSRYPLPRIMLFDAGYTPIAKKQTFSMTLWLEL
jgi:hypothetical protein